MRSWNRSPRLTRRALREGGGLDLDVLHCRGPTTSWCARVRQRLTRPVETSLECRSHSSTPNTTPLPCRGKVDSHILMFLVCALAWQETWIFQEVFCTLHLLTSCVIIVPTLWQSGGRDGAQAGKFLRTYQRSSRSPFNARSYSYKRNGFGNMHYAWHLDCNILTMFHITS